MRIISLAPADLLESRLVVKPAGGFIVLADFQEHAARFKGLVLVVRFGNRSEAIPNGFESPLKRLEEMMSRGGRAIGYAGIKTVQGGGSEGSIWPIEPYSPGEVGADLRAMLQHIGKMGGVDFAL